MANLHRGEIAAELGGRTYTLCLTLGALAELEAAFGAGDLVALAERFETARLSANDILKIIGCGMRGGGNVLSNSEIAALPAVEGLKGYADIAARLLAATFGTRDEEGADPVSPP
ncbi:MAG: gene transfer agent family protein [Hyphomicrobiales bacterium]|nr:gene transfer agent family protein [Hyphomicrobiales bacterium]